MITETCVAQSRIDQRKEMFRMTSKVSAVLFTPEKERLTHPLVDSWYCIDLFRWNKDWRDEIFRRVYCYPVRQCFRVPPQEEIQLIYVCECDGHARCEPRQIHRPRYVPISTCRAALLKCDGASSCKDHTSPLCGERHMLQQSRKYFHQEDTLHCANPTFCQQVRPHKPDHLSRC